MAQKRKTSKDLTRSTARQGPPVGPGGFGGLHPHAHGDQRPPAFFHTVDEATYLKGRHLSPKGFHPKRGQR